MKNLRDFLRRLRESRRGVAAIEFVLVLPVAIVTYLGMVEYSHYMMVKAKVVQAALQIEDLVGRQSTVTATTFSTICGFAKTMVSPVALTGFQITIANETVSSAGATSIAWEVQSPVATSSTTSLTCPKVSSPAVIALPSSFLAMPQISSNSVIVVQVTYSYSRVTKNSVFSYLPYTLSLPALSYQKLGYFRYTSNALSY